MFLRVPRGFHGAVHQGPATWWRSGSQQDAETDEIVAVMELDGCDGFATLKKLKKTARPCGALCPLNAGV